MKRVCYVGIDVGGTNIKAGIVTRGGMIIHRVIHKIRSDERTEEGIVFTIKRIVEEVEYKVGLRCQGVGIGLPGFIDMARGIVTVSPNYPEWKNFPAKDMLKSALKRTIVLDNDANLFAVGEGWVGAGKRMKSFMGITLGTGVGAGIVLNHEVWHGADGSAGEFGHITVDPDGPLCRCGNKGCIESFVSSYGILRTAEQIYGKKFEMDEAEVPKFIHQQALKGDKRAERTFELCGRMLGIGIATVANLLNLEGVIIGGGIGKAFRFLVKGIRKEMLRAKPLPRNRLKILRSKLFEKANILGGAYQVIKYTGR